MQSAFDDNCHLYILSWTVAASEQQYWDSLSHMFTRGLLHQLNNNRIPTTFMTYMKVCKLPFFFSSHGRER